MKKSRASIFSGNRAAWRAIGIWAREICAGAFCAVVLLSCLPGERLAGGSTEAGNAGGKLSLSDGSPAAGVSVTLVARSYLPDTLASGSENVPGSYYRTRTGQDGRFNLDGIVPGEYRVIAVGDGGGAMAESVKVEAGGDTVLVEKTMRPLGGIRGVAKLVGSRSKANLWVLPRATVRRPPLADARGGFRLDSLPEGEYELVPKCFSCQPSRQGYRVRVTAGMDTTLSDTLKVYPEHFQGFPDSGLLVLKPEFLPFSVMGKTHRGDEDSLLPTEARWTWNGAPLAGRDVGSATGISETEAILDSGMFRQAPEGRLRLVLIYPDTAVARDWLVRLDGSEKEWPLSLVEAGQGFRIASPEATPMWRFRVVRSVPLSPSDLSFWGVDPGRNHEGKDLPEWVELVIDPNDLEVLGGTGPAGLTFVLIPDSSLGGRVFRPRRNERLEDFAKIRFMERVRLGFTDSLEPSMFPEGLVLDRFRAGGVAQRYRIDSAGKTEEVIAPLDIPGTPLLFYRFGPASLGFSWERPLRDAAMALAVTREGLAVRFDGSGFSRILPASEIDALVALLTPLAGDPPPLPDTANLEAGSSLAYLHFGKRGRFHVPGGNGPVDSIAAAFGIWMERNGLQESAGFPFTDGAWRFLGFISDSTGRRYSGDTLMVERIADSAGMSLRESLTPGSPAYAGDTNLAVYRLFPEGDSLVAFSDRPQFSRLFGAIDGRLAPFALKGLGKVAPDFRQGLPVLPAGESLLAGLLPDTSEILGRILAAPRLMLDARGVSTRPGWGFVFTPDGGLETAWRFGARSGIITGWSKE